MRRNRRLIALGAVAICLLLTACGSRRPLSDFLAAQPGASGATGATGGTAGEGTTGGTGTGPGASVAGGKAGGATLGGAARSGGNGSAGGSTTGGSGKSANGAANTASDVGVTPTTITVGQIFTKSGAFGPYQFTSMAYGAQAYFDYLNDHGGINGRKIVVQPCDDGGNPANNQNCAHALVGSNSKSSGVFAFVGDNCLACDGLKYISDQKVPQVGGLAIDSKDYALPHAWRYSGNPFPQNGSIGWKGKLYQGTQQFHWFKDKLGVTKAAVVWYSNSAPSASAGQGFAQGLREEGMQVTTEAVNLALPQWDSIVLDMKQKGVQAVFDTIDVSGNQNLCKSMDSNNYVPKAKVSTISTWSQAVATQFHYPCRSYIYSFDAPGSLGYDETSNAEIAKFRAAWSRYFPQLESNLFQWAVDGWASAMWFADAASSCGANLTRTCLETYLNKPGYTAHGIWWPRPLRKVNFDTEKTNYQCVTVDKWNEPKKTFVTVADWHNTCYTTPYYSYNPNG